MVQFDVVTLKLII